MHCNFCSHHRFISVVGHMRILKVISLITLTLQNAMLGLSMRYACTRPGDQFLSSTAVLMAEFVKLLASLLLVYKEEGNSRRLIVALRVNIIQRPADTLKVCVPSLLYIVQNNLLYLSASHLDAATYQVIILIHFSRIDSITNIRVTLKQISQLFFLYKETIYYANHFHNFGGWKLPICSTFKQFHHCVSMITISVYAFLCIERNSNHAYTMVKIVNI